MSNESPSVGFGEPERGLLAVVIRAGQIVVARAHRHASCRPQQWQVLQNDHALRLERDGRADAEAVPGHDHEVEFLPDADDPVELGERVVEVRDEEYAHAVRSGARH
jgi:hypothetical protein